VFESARAKIDRAKLHFNALQVDFADFVDDKAYTIGIDVEPETSKWSMVYLPAPLPPSWPIILGELLYQLRSALDHIVCELSGGIEMTEFPIFEDEGLYRQRKKNGTPTNLSGLHKIRGISNKLTLREIERLQPYHAPKNRMHVLLLLKHLCNIDKHRTLHLCRRQPAEMSFTSPVGGGRVRVTLPDTWEHRAVITRGDSNPEMQVKPKFTFFVAFDEGRVPGLAGRSVQSICEILIASTESTLAVIEKTLR
jgi:hypothetical protein